jgi:uncharacterized Zn-finger protein
VLHVPANRTKDPDLAGDLPNTLDQIEVTRAELPVHCPAPGTTLWNSHPRVYIPLEEGGSAICPYCGTKYVLVD